MRSHSVSSQNIIPFLINTITISFHDASYPNPPSIVRYVLCVYIYEYGGGGGDDGERVSVCGRIGVQRKSKVLASTFSSCYIS